MHVCNKLEGVFTFVYIRYLLWCLFYSVHYCHVDKVNKISEDAKISEQTVEIVKLGQHSGKIKQIFSHSWLRFRPQSTSFGISSESLKFINMQFVVNENNIVKIKRVGSYKYLRGLILCLCSQDVLCVNPLYGLHFTISRVYFSHLVVCKNNFWLLKKKLEKRMLLEGEVGEGKSRSFFWRLRGYLIVEENLRPLCY